MKNSVKKICFVVLLSVIFLLPIHSKNLSLLDGNDDWLRRVASPTYGLSFGFAEIITLDQDWQEHKSTKIMPGIEFRHFNGINASPGGGFYYGYEIGLGFNFNTGGDTYVSGLDGTSYTLEDLQTFRLFLMLKHGYRFNFSPDPDGFSLGLELGIGIAGGGGNVKFDEVGEDRSYSAGTGGAQPMGELGFEAAFNLRERVRFSTRLGFCAIGQMIDTDYSDFDDIGLRATMVPLMINLRVGFRMMH